MKEIRQLTGLRGVVALDVVLGHYPYRYVPLARHLIFHDAAVDIFFCLSSFTLCLVYGAGSGRALALRDFAVARVARIYPVALLSLCLMLAILIFFNRGVFDPARIDHTIVGLVWQGLLLAALPIPRLFGFWDIPAWSVSVDLVCYALMFPVLFRISRPVAGMPAWLTTAAIVACCGIDVWVFLDAYQSSIMGIGYGAASRALAYWVPLMRGSSMFAAGWLGYLLLTAAPLVSGTARRWVDVTAIAFLAIVILASSGIGQRQWVVFLAPALIVGLMNDRALVSRLLSTGPFVYLGRLSYSIYLLHVPVLTGYQVHALFRVGNALDFYAPFAELTILSVLSYHGVETPLRRLIRGKRV